MTWQVTAVGSRVCCSVRRPGVRQREGGAEESEGHQLDGQGGEVGVGVGVGASVGAGGGGGGGGGGRRELLGGHSADVRGAVKQPVQARTLPLPSLRSLPVPLLPPLRDRPTTRLICDCHVYMRCSWCWLDLSVDSRG